MINRPKILFIHNSLRKFVEIDLAILRQKYDVTEWEIRSLCVNPFEVFWKVFQHDAVYCWFASWFSLLPVIFSRWLHKPSLVVTGCYETVSNPDIQFGFQQDRVRKYIPRIIFAHASKLIVPSQFSFEETLRTMGGSADRLVRVYQGLDPEPYQMGNLKEPLVITVGDINEENLTRKGLETFVEIAKKLPEIRFIIIGKCHTGAYDRLKRKSPPNVHFTDYLPFPELLSYMQKAKVYVQASKHEAFGLSMAEAMLCGCIPVISGRAALPEVVGDTGFYASSDHLDDYVKAVQAAINSDESKGKAARERILKEFNILRRADALFNLIEDLLTHQKKESYL